MLIAPNAFPDSMQWYSLSQRWANVDTVVPIRLWANIRPTGVAVRVWSHWKLYSSKWIKVVLNYEWPSENPIPFHEVHEVPHNCWKSMLISIEATWKYIKEVSRRSDKVLWSTSTFVLSLSAFVSGECWFPQLAQSQCVAYVFITFSCELLLNANYLLKLKQ